MTLHRLPVIVLFLSAAFAVASTSTAHAAAPRIYPAAHSDKRDVVGGSLDVTRALFGQHEARLRLYVKTKSAFSVSDLDPATGRSLCLELFYSPATTLRSRICVGALNGSLGLQYQAIDETGHVVSSRSLETPVERRGRRALEASFTAIDVDLPRERIAWRIASQWIDDAGCATAAPCIDHVPDEGLLRADVGLVGGPRCLGAASRDPLATCSNPSLRLSVFPRRALADSIPNSYCSQLRPQGLLTFCAFGVAPSKAVATVALVGDSFASHWRGALEVVAQAKGWRGLTLTRSSCPLTRAHPILPSATKSRRCQVWNNQIQAWFRRHPEVNTVAVAAHPVKTRTSAEAGYRAAWKALPDSVRHIFVIRSTPRSRASARCLARAVKRRKRPGLACAEPRSERLRRDPQAAAAYSARSERVRVVDMTRYFCGARRCYPVIGGLLVHKDGGHLTRIFAATLGPFLLRRINHLMGA